MAFSHMLVPTDFGEASEEAIEVAIGLAAKLEAKITLLHSFDLSYPLIYANGFYVPMAEVVRQAQSVLRGNLTRVQERHANTQALFTRGEPWRHILHCAENGVADVIIMGTHGRPNMSRFLLGSTAEKVVRLSSVPVLTVSPRPLDRPASAVSSKSNPVEARATAR